MYSSKKVGLPRKFEFYPRSNYHGNIRRCRTLIFFATNGIRNLDVRNDDASVIGEHENLTHDQSEMMMNHRNLHAFTRSRNTFDHLRKAEHKVAYKPICLVPAKITGVHDSCSRKDWSEKISNVTFQMNVTNAHFNTSNTTTKNIPEYLIGLNTGKKKSGLCCLHKKTVSYPEQLFYSSRVKRNKFDINSAGGMENISILKKSKIAVQIINTYSWHLFRKPIKIFGTSQIRRQFSSNNGNDSTKGLLRLFLFQIHPDYFLQVSAYEITFMRVFYYYQSEAASLISSES